MFEKIKYIYILSFVFYSYLLLCVTTPLYAVEPLEIVVEGIEGDELINVKAALAIPEGLVENGQVNVQWLEYFKSQVIDKVKTAMEPFGYYDPLITVNLESPDNEHFRLVVRVEPGEPVRISSVDVNIHGSGAGEASLRKLVNEFPLHKGGVLLQPRYEDAKGSLMAQALDLGYLDSEFDKKRILVSIKEHSATIELDLVTGPRYYFGKTVFEGVTNYPAKFLDRYLTFKEGEVFSNQKIDKSQRNFVNSERFSEVAISPERNKTINYRVPIVVHLKEALPKHIRVGVGYGTDTGARFTLKYYDLDVFRKGNEIHSELTVAQRIQALTSSYVMPSYRNIDSFSALKLNVRREDITTYKTKSLSIEFDRAHSFGNGRIGTAYVEALEEQSNIASESPKTFAILPGIRFSQRRYDNLIRPTHGFSYSLELRGTHEFLGSNFALVQFLADGNLLISLPWRLTVLSRANIGLSLEDKSLSALPASLRFFAGGEKSVRGYDYQSLGPKNASGQITGGQQLFFGSMEIERALFSSWGIACFYDAGNAFNSFSDVTLFQDAGVGLRYYTKVGPIKLDIARRIFVPKPGFKFQFSFGFDL